MASDQPIGERPSPSVAGAATGAEVLGGDDRTVVEGGSVEAVEVVGASVVEGGGSVVVVVSSVVVVVFALAALRTRGRIVEARSG